MTKLKIATDKNKINYLPPVRPFLSQTLMFYTLLSNSMRLRGRPCFFNGLNVLQSVMFRLIFILAFFADTTPQELDDGREMLPVVPHVSGMRVETQGFLGYTEAWELIVQPDVYVKVVVFGYWLDKVEYVTFTDQVCITSEFNISFVEFQEQTETRIAFMFKFPEWDRPWKMCVKQRGPFGELLLIDDDRTWITTEIVHLKEQERFFPAWMRITFMLVLFVLSSLFSGLNLGLMSLSTQELNLLIKSGSPQQANYAKAIFPVRKNGNQLLCTILIMNVVVNSAITILFGDFVTGGVALVASTLGIVVFGEIIPQSVCVKHGLAIGARTLFLTKIFMVLTYILAKPISMVLDFFLGEEVDNFNRNRLVEIMKMTTENESHQDNKDLADDLKIAVGAMEFTHKVAKDSMTRIDDVYMLSEDDTLDVALMAEIIKKGYTRIPVYYNNDRNQVHSILFVQDLALVDKKNNISVRTVSEYHNRELRIVDENTPLPDLLEEFKRGDYHLAMVYKSERKLKPVSRTASSQSGSTNDAKQPLLEGDSVDSFTPPSNPVFVGIITLEDLIEEILQSEILDEYDTVLDNIQKTKRQMSQGRITEFICCETRGSPLSFNMLQVVCEWLENHSLLFDERHMDKRAREKMVQRNIRQAILLTRDRETITQIVNIYEAGVVSRRMVLILEGKAKAVFPKTGMQFIIEPWTFFGDVLIEKIMKAKQTKQEVTNSFHFVPDYDLIVDHPCKFLQIPVTSLLHALRISQFIKKMSSPHGSMESMSDRDDDHVPGMRSRSTRRGSIHTRHSSLVGHHNTGERCRSVSTVVGPPPPPRHRNSSGEHST